jgi:hypothetical protein
MEKERQQGQSLCSVGKAGDTKSSGSHIERREGSSSPMRRAGARTHQGQGACQVKKARSSMDWYGRSIGARKEETKSAIGYHVCVCLSRKDRNKKRGVQATPVLFSFNLFRFFTGV